MLRGGSGRRWGSLNRSGLTQRLLGVPFQLPAACLRVMIGIATALDE
jgi:hypothetical protein